jgi:lipoprotein LprG
LNVWTYTRGILILLLVVAAAACNPLDDDDEPEATPTASAVPIEDLPPEQIIARAVERWNATESAHFRLEVDGATYLDNDEQIELAEAEGDLARPQSVEATAQIAISLVTLDVSLIFIGDEAYMTDFLTGNWGPAPDDFSYNPALLLSETEGLGPVLERLQDPNVAGLEQVDGVDAVHMTGTVTEDMIGDLTAGAISGDVIDVDIWFNAESLDVVQLHLAEPDDGTTWIIRLTEHNEPVTIEAPEV